MKPGVISHSPDMVSGELFPSFSHSEQICKGITGRALASHVLSFASIKEYGKGVC